MPIGRTRIAVAIAGAAVAIAAGFAACTLHVDYTGTTFACGSDGSCPTGDVCSAGYCVPSQTTDGGQPLGPTTCAVSVTAAGAHSCAIRTDGTVWCWGENGNSQLGDGTTATRTTPVEVIDDEVQPKPIPGAIQVVAGLSHSCALVGGGQVLCWGSNKSGQLGTGVDSSVAKAVAGLTATRLAAGDFHTCALDGNGAVWCWGNDNSGQLGDGQEQNRNAPAMIAGLAGVTQLAAGGQETCAIVGSGAASTLDCWGADDDGQIGIGMPGGDDVMTPTAVKNLTGVAAVAVAEDFACAATTTGAVYCWGTNGDGQLGDSTTHAGAALPGLVPLPAKIVTLVAGAQHMCALDDQKRLWCWGTDQNGEQFDASGGNDNPAAELVSVASFPLGTEAITGIGAGSGHTCVTTGAGSIVCAGGNNQGQLGDGFQSDDLAPVTMKGGGSATGVVAAASQTCVAFPNANGAGALYSCVGQNFAGQLGDGTYADQSLLQPIVGGEPVAKLGMGWDHSCMVRTDGSVACWGNGDDGELGVDGADNPNPSPITVALPMKAIDIASGRGHSCAVLANGNVMCWGEDDSGQDGDGGDDSDETPVQAAGVNGATAVACGDSHTCAVIAAGQVQCWGDNDHGERGIGSGAGGPVVGLSGVAQLAASGKFTCARKGDGSVWCWGFNGDGELGDGNTTDAGTPQQAFTGAAAIAAGIHTACAIDGAGAVWCWGADYAGQLGNGDPMMASVSHPVQVTGVTGATSIAASGDHTCAVAAGGVMCWGADVNGQLGNGIPQALVPQSVGLPCPSM